MSDRTVGIIGGMGPAATLDLMHRVIALTPASDDADHIRMLVDNNPKVPSRIKALIEKTGPSPGPAITQMARKLAEFGADFLAMPCNTAHHYYGEIAAAVDIPVLNIMQLVAEHVSRRHPGATRVGLLASSALQQIRLYEPYFEERGVDVCYPNIEGQSRLMQVIRSVKAGDAGLDYSGLNDAVENLANAGADCLVIACTELSVVVGALRSSLPVYDGAEILAAEIVRRARK